MNEREPLTDEEYQDLKEQWQTTDSLELCSELVDDFIATIDELKEQLKAHEDGIACFITEENDKLKEDKRKLIEGMNRIKQYAHDGLGKWDCFELYQIPTEFYILGSIKVQARGLIWEATKGELK